MKGHPKIGKMGKFGCEIVKYVKYSRVAKLAKLITYFCISYMRELLPKLFTLLQMYTNLPNSQGYNYFTTIRTQTLPFY